MGQVATPEPSLPSASFGSAHENLMTTSLLYQPSALGLVAGAPVICGPARSMSMPVTDAGPELLPALSDTVAGPAPRLRPSSVMTLSAGTVSGSTPDSASDALQWTVTSSLYQPALLGAAVAAPLSEGGVRSMLMSLTVVSLVLPALSSALPGADWPAPSFESVIGSVQPAMPDSASEQSKVTVTGVLFHPKPFAAGSRLPLMVGGIPSIFSVTK